MMTRIQPLLGTVNSCPELPQDEVIEKPSRYRKKSPSEKLDTPLSECSNGVGSETNYLVGL